MLYRVVIFRHSDDTTMYVSKWSTDFNEVNGWSDELVAMSKPGEIYPIIEEEEEDCSSEDETLG